MNHSEFVDDAARLLDAHAGGYLFNTIAETGTTCLECRTPVAGYSTCLACSRLNARGYPRADRRGFMTYAISGRQSETLMYGYKGAQGGGRHRAIVRSLLQVGFFGHSGCALALGGGTAARWAFVPSLRGRDGSHPLADIMRALVVPGLEVSLVPAVRVGDPRAFDPGHFSVGTSLPVDCHMFLLDDTWVGGGHAESAGLALRQAGATQVSILNVARMLNMGWSRNPPFVKSRLASPYDTQRCPWTPTGACP